MKKRLLLGSAILAVCALAGLVVTWRGSANSYYQGKSIRTWLSTGGPEAETAWRAMGAKAVPELSRLARSKEPPFRGWLRARLPSLPRRVREPALRFLGPPNSVSTREAAARALGIIGPQAKGAVPVLIQDLHDPEGRVCWEAALALGRIGPEAVQPLIRTLQNEETRARWTAAYALGEMGPPAQPAIPALLHTLSDTNEQVRGSSSYSLSVICGSPVSGLVTALGQGDTMARKAAARQLGDVAIELRKATPVLARMAQSDWPEVRAQALETLGVLRPQEGLVLSTLLKGLNDPEVDVRLAALRALARPGWNAQRVVPKLTECLNDPSTEVRTNAALALSNYESRK